MAEQRAGLRDGVSRVGAALLRAAGQPTTTFDDRSLTAASSPVMVPLESPSAPLLTPEALRTRQEGWQRRILELADMVPEVAGAAALVRGSTSRIKLVLEGGSNSDVRRRLQLLLDQLDFDRLCELIWLSGEAYVALPDHGKPYSLSVTELNTHSKPVEVKDATNSSRKMTDPFFRVWKPSRKNRWQASSPNQAALDLIESMYVHQLADTAVATSRLAGAGILVWPTDREDMPFTDDGKPAPGSRQEMLRQFQDAALQSIKNRESLDATVPFVVFVDPDMENSMPQMLRLDRDDHADQYKTRYEIYRLRYATAIDLPIESVTGMGETNHWSAWAIREDQWRSYLAPLVQLAVDALQERMINPIDAGIRIKVDATDLIAKPDQTATILRLMQLDKIDTAYALQQLNLDPLKAQDPRQMQYATQQMEGIPSDMTLGGERGGGQYRG